MKSFIIPTTSTEHLVKNILNKSSGFKILFLTKNKEGKCIFPDGEVYVRIPEAKLLKNKRVIVLHSGAPRPNDGLVELELTLQVLKNASVKSIEVFFTYFPYSQQDKVFGAGETNAAENLIKKLIDYYGVKKIYVIDAHFWGNTWVKKYPISNISAVPILIKKAKKEFGEDILFLSPDKGGKRRINILGARKRRINSFKTEMVLPQMEFRGKTIAVIDDIVETGGTLSKFSELVKKAGAKRSLALITHGVLTSGIKRVKKAFPRLYLTNTINQNESTIDITDLILETIRYLTINLNGEFNQIKNKGNSRLAQKRSEF